LDKIKKKKFLKKILSRDNVLYVYEKDIPFQIKRVFFISNLKKNSIRGAHAHKKCHQIIFSLCGNINIKLKKNGKKKLFKIKNNEIGLLVPKLNWIEIKNLSKNNIIVVFCSEKYSEKDYIRNYNEYLKYEKKN